MNINPKNCPTCGVALPPDSPLGLCPHCLLRGATDLPPSNDAKTGVLPDATTAVPTTPHSLRVPYFGDYELIGEIARGGMGVVYRARQVSLNRIVALKMILSGQFASEDEVKRFRVEAEAAANLQHPHIVAIHEVGEHEGHHYFSMDFIEGKNLAEYAMTNPIPAREAARLVKTLAAAVHYAHQRGTLHRDLKPQNVLIDAGGEPHITDFGLAKRWRAPTGGAEPVSGKGSTPNLANAARDPELTSTGALMGTPSYMAPEQAAPHMADVSPATDVYSLGAILYRLLVGQPPHRGKTAMETVLKVIGEEPTSPSKVKADVPADLAIICLKCLEKAPERRYSNARFLAEDLDRFLEGEPILARPAGAPRKVWSWALRHPWSISGSASLVILGLGLSTYWLWEKTQYLAWLAAHPGQIPFNYWPAQVEYELPISTILLVITIWLTSLGCLWDLVRRKNAQMRVGGALLGFYSAIALGHIGCCFLVSAKAVRICVWNDAPPLVSVAVIVYLQTVLWGGLQALWNCIRTLLHGQSGVEPPDDFLSSKPRATVRVDGPFSFRRPWRTYVAQSNADGLGSLEPLRAVGLVGPMLTVWLALGLTSLWLQPRQKTAWCVSAFFTVILVHSLAGSINPTWVVHRTMLSRSTLNQYRFSYATFLMAGAAAYALLFVVPHSSGPTESSLAGLIAGVLLVLWRRMVLRREAADVKSRPPS